MESRLREARDERVVLDETTLMSLTRAVERAADGVSRDPDDLELLERWETLVAVVRESGVDVDLRRAQNDYYRLMKTVRPAKAGERIVQCQSLAAAFRCIGREVVDQPRGDVVHSMKPIPTETQRLIEQSLVPSDDAG